MKKLFVYRLIYTPNSVNWLIRYLSNLIIKGIIFSLMLTIMFSGNSWADCYIEGIPKIQKDGLLSECDQSYIRARNNIMDLYKYPVMRVQVNNDNTAVAQASSIFLQSKGNIVKFATARHNIQMIFVGGLSGEQLTQYFKQNFPSQKPDGFTDFIIKIPNNKYTYYYIEKTDGQVTKEDQKLYSDQYDVLPHINLTINELESIAADPHPHKDADWALLSFQNVVASTLYSKINSDLGVVRKDLSHSNFVIGWPLSNIGDKGGTGNNDINFNWMSIRDLNKIHNGLPIERILTFDTVLDPDTYRYNGNSGGGCFFNGKLVGIDIRQSILNNNIQCFNINFISNELKAFLE